MPGPWITQVAGGTAFDNSTNGFTADNVQDAIEESQSLATGKIQDFSFYNNGNTRNKWLAYASSSSPSNEVPYTAPFSGFFEAITFTNEDDDTSTNIEIYKNGSLFFVWEIRNKRTAYNTNSANLPSGQILQGDRLSVFFRDQGENLNSPVVQLLIQIDPASENEGGTQFGV